MVMAWANQAIAWGNSGGWGNEKSWWAWEKTGSGTAWGKSDKQEKWRKEKPGKRYCSMSQEKELLKLLKELDKPFSSIKKMRGGLSEARWKYNIVRKLRKFDDCRAEDALKKLSEDNLCEDWGEDDVFCVKWAADSSMQEAKSAADLKKLKPGSAIKDQLKIIRKYTKRPYQNDFAVNRIAHYLTEQADKQPDIFIPLLVELFPHKPKTEKLAQKYPLAANKGLKKLLSSARADDVWWGINLANYLKKTKFLQQVYAVAIEKKGNLDYQNQENRISLRRAAGNYFRALLPESQPYIERLKGTEAGFAYCSSAAKGCKTTRMINRYLFDLAANAPNYAVTRSIGKSSGLNGPSADGQDINAILITENAAWDDDHGKPTVVITGAIHGNEWATPEVCLGLAEYLLENKENTAPAVDELGEIINKEARRTASDGGADIAIRPRIDNVSDLLRKIQVIIIPVLNPDGYDFSHTTAGKGSYYGVGWRPNRRDRALLDKEEVCYRRDGSVYPKPPLDAEHCFLADYDARDTGGDLDEEDLVVCESANHKKLSLFESSLNVSSDEMFEAIYSSTNPARVVCATGERRVWKEKWSDDNDDEVVSLEEAKADGYIQKSHGVDLNRNFQYKWDMVENQENLFIRSRSPSSRVYRGKGKISEAETRAMERLIAQKNVVALIDYHSGSTQVLYPYAYSTTRRADRNLLVSRWGEKDYQVFQQVSEKIAAILNRHDRADKSIIGYTAAQNYNNTSTASGVARDCYYQVEGIAALNIEVHDKRYMYEHEEFKKVVPEICKTSVPGAVWFLFWAAEIRDGGPGWE
jgi:hypothetical protein